MYAAYATQPQDFRTEQHSSAEILSVSIAMIFIAMTIMTLVI